MSERCPGMCCDLHEVPLLDDDVARLGAHTGQPSPAFVDEADGWRLLRGAGTEPGGCVFFGDVAVGGRRHRGCTVHEARPAACRTYPFVLRRGDDGEAMVGRDDACPYRDAFAMPEGIRSRLSALWTALETERATRVQAAPRGRGGPLG